MPDLTGILSPTPHYLGHELMGMATTSPTALPEAPEF